MNSPARYSVDTLEALVKLIRTEGIDHSPRLYVRGQPRRVMVDTTYTHKEYAEFSRLPLYEAVSDVPSISVNQYMSQEHAVIELQSLYAVTEDRDYLLALLSRIDVNQGVSSVDNRDQPRGQRPHRRGAEGAADGAAHRPPAAPTALSLRSNSLPATSLLRLDKEGHPALYEADGGAWKLEAKRNIAAYLGEQLADLVECGSVVVMI